MITSSHGSFRKAKTKRSDWVTFHLHVDSKKPIFLFAYSGTKGSWFEPFFRCEPGFHRYLLIGVSCDHDFFTDAKNKVSGPPRYLQRCRKAYRKFSRATWKKIAVQNMRFCQNILHDFELHFSKSQLFSLFLTYNQIGASYGHDFLLTQRTRLDGTPRYLQYCCKAYRKFSTNIWKKSCNSKYEVLSEYSNLIFNFILIKPHMLSCNFFFKCL